MDKEAEMEEKELSKIARVTFIDNTVVDIEADELSSYSQHTFCKAGNVVDILPYHSVKRISWIDTDNKP